MNAFAHGFLNAWQEIMKNQWKIGYNVDHQSKDIFKNGFPRILDQIFTLIGQGVCFG